MTHTQTKTDGTRTDEIPVQPPPADGAEETVQIKKAGFENASTDQSTRQTSKPQNQYDYNTISEIIKANIEYEYMIAEDPNYQEPLDGIVHVITSTITTEFSDGRITMGAERVHAETVKSVFFKLTREDVEYLQDNFDRQTMPITKITPYIRTALYRNHGIVGLYWQNRVNTDMPHMAGKKRMLE